PQRLLRGRRGLVVADGNEIAEDLVADVSPLLDYLLGRRPILVADLASAENPPAVDHVLGNAAVSEVPGHRFDLHGVGTRPAVDDLTVVLGARVSVLADLFLLEV